LAKIQWFGQPGHFIGADKCRFHLHTHVNGHCISTVGEYYPDPGGRAETVGSDRFYETMVFDEEDAGAGQHVDFAAYNDHRSADAGHAAMVEKWAAAQDRTPSPVSQE
jgi:hypothetical protein